MTCRVCAQPFFPEPLLEYRNMPAAAQGFPDTPGGDRGADLQVCQCSGCGLVQLSGEPVPYYREVIRAAGISPVLRAAKRKQFSSFVEQFGLRGKKVIEIGCGRGEFLSILQELPVEAHGLEYSEEAVQSCRTAGLRVAQGYPAKNGSGMPGAPFDGFLLLMFLEHFPEPNAALRAIGDLLAPGAVGLVEVPNFDMMVRQRLFSEFIADHLLYFSQDTLERTLQVNGFEVIGTEQLRDDYVLSVVVRKREPLNLADFRLAQESVTRALQEFVAGFPHRRVAVWGAGHQALAVLALTGIANAIRYVVDSAPFKQGKWTPATHRPIVSPDALKADPVDGIIVMAASYSDEVAAIIAREHGGRMRVAILRQEGLEIVAEPELSQAQR